jgi:tripartite ATP-independent transporter DctP family solute receptor
MPPSHPVVLRLNGAVKAVAEASSGAIELGIFPSSQLGSDTDVLSQVRSGAVEIQLISGGVLANLVPAALIYNTAFAFPNEQSAFEALDGDLGEFIRQETAKVNIEMLPGIWNNGYRQISTSSVAIEEPEDLKGMKFRVAPAPMLMSVFTAFGTSPTVVNIADTYTALQTKVVDGQENGLALFSAMKFYEVQPYCAITNHMWDGFVTLAGKRFYEGLSEQNRDILLEQLRIAETAQRQDVIELDASLEEELKDKNVTFTHPDPAKFQAALREAGYYAEWKEKLGEKGWAALEKYAGKLT